MNPIAVLNLVACGLIFWTCGSFLLVRGQAQNVRQFATQIGLLLAMVGAMVSAVAPLREFGALPAWWSVTLRVGVAIVATSQYDKAFGISRQMNRAFRDATGTPARLAAWWRNALDTAHAARDERDRNRK